ncbi:orotidine-5-phosphate decarboxylase/orotate phosphoribosyltransferase [Trypanosoma rangeli]|uniref:Orotidine-5-phosphate decarboxylase/orotate phosphoribosyltransferase n=1 Tax=Trypanosoma rangeli TaxID=5698 RepID=A0A422N974_TRYRA|nr:orotidine-5-phosphate decarboxylase/orotate phosphoribosyltransferase [Trypanosoma rangeli]RNF02001.1 orotidine-5-phosphate decarboxylase/orotate phosphoribosyltransferase [Trypanosoma rangeli]|eukprot:RNF02001.1 orotidine-5-phosphate decarboxylase/orotate phosphoribosyltransferase [Trypanosoma rangeli]
MDIPLVYPRREVKAYGTKAAIEGDYKEGDRVVVIDDLVTTGETKVEAIEKLKAAGLNIVSIVVLIDREMGAKQFLGGLGYDLKAVVTLSQLLPLWRQSGAITQAQMKEVQSFMVEVVSKL